RGRIGVGFHEINARKSDFAFVAAAAQVALDDDGKCLDVALGIGGVGDRPVRLDLSHLVGSRLEAAAVTDAVTAVAADLEATDDLHASAAYRRRVAIALGSRAVADAVASAGGERLEGASR